MPCLFAFWAVDRHGRPLDPDAHDPWGERSPLDALDVRDPETVGSFLTVTDETTGAVLFAGDASDALRAFVVETAAETGWTPDPDDPPHAATLDACHVLADAAGDEWAREAVYGWAEPDPDTSRNPRRMPEHVRRGIRHGAVAVGHEVASDALRDHLLARILPARLAA